MAARCEVREYAANRGGARMQVAEHGGCVRAAVADEHVWASTWFYADSFEDAIRYAMREWNTAWRRVELTHIGW